MAGPTVSLAFEGDADSLIKEAKKAESAASGVGDAVTESSKDMEKASQSSGGLTDKLSKLGNITDGAATAIDGATGTLQAFIDVQDADRQAAQKLARATNDVAQAQLDYNQALQDGKQAAQDGTQAKIDAKQASLDMLAAEQDYKDAVKESGAGSIEAQQALLDREQAQADLVQAQRDGEQATLDGTQATIDAKGAQTDLNDAQSEANPTELQKWADTMNTYAPLLQGVVAVFALVTAAQWAFNAAQAASPIFWVIAGIVALVAVIVLIATKTRWFQEAWTNAWEWIKDAAENTWNWLGDALGWLGTAFANTAMAMTAPFREAFNFIADAWNNTIGSLSWTVPGWVPGIGGFNISVPNLPKFHSGGTVGGAQGQESLAILQAGEKVIPRGQAANGGGAAVTFAGNTDAAFAALFMQLVRSGQITVSA